MLADEPPPAVHAQPAEVQPDVIEVIGQRRQQVLKIDRRTYHVVQSPHSAQKDAIQLLQGLPAVSIAPDNKIMLLGSGAATIYINGRPYPGDARQYLKTLHGSDIENIEIMTNPSAQFSSEGTGGVINFILRANSNPGWTGNASIEGSTYERALFDTTLNYKRDRWAYEIKAGGNVGSLSRSTYSRERIIDSSAGDRASSYRESGDNNYNGTDGRLSGKAVYDLDTKTTLTASVGGGGGHDTLTYNSQFYDVSSGAGIYHVRRRLNSDASFVTAELNVDHKGRRDGESLTAGASFYGNPNSRDITHARYSDGGSYRVSLSKPTVTGNAQIDWKRPLSLGQILSVGASWRIDASWQDYDFANLSSDSTLGSNTSDTFDGYSRTLAGYVTFQQTLGKLTVVPGVRIENNRRKVMSPSVPDVRLNRTNAFPTFHFKYDLLNNVELTASYSKRIDRASLQYLRPYSTVEDVLTVFQGNPTLKDQSTDAYEINLHYRKGKIDAGLIAYFRQTKDLWSKIYSVNSSGASSFTYTNAGSSVDRGAQFDLGFPLMKRVKANLSINLFDQETPVDIANASRQRTFRYTTNGTLQWTGADHEDVPGDVAQLQWSYNSPSRGYQSRDSAWVDLSASFTHSFDKTLSLSGTFQYFGQTRQRVLSDTVYDSSYQRRTAEFRIKIMKTFGKR